MISLKHEISRVLPDGQTKHDFSHGIPILKAFECILYELETDNDFIYTAVNINTGKSQKLSRQRNPMSPTDAEDMAARIRLSRVAGVGRLEIERPFDRRIELRKAHEILSTIVKDILPRCGYTMPPEQIAFSEHVLNTISRRSISFIKMEIDTDNTLAYLIPAVIAKLGRLNDFHNLSLYPEMAYADMAYMPIVIAASSDSLQNALVNDYIPVLSQVLIDAGVIKRPLNAALRKSKGSYLCERNLRSHLPFERDHGIKQILSGLLLPFASIDLADADGLTPQLKAKISVPPRCLESCSYKEVCRYRLYCDEAQDPAVDIQVCSHHYLLTDTLRRAKGNRALIPNYQILLIDEANKFYSAARSAYKSELSSTTAPELLESIDNIAFKYETARRAARKSAKKLADESKRLFRSFTSYPVVELDADAVRHLRNIRDIADRIALTLRGEVFRIKAGELLAWVQAKYNADITAIDLNKLIPATIYDAPTIERQTEIMKTQTNQLYKAICSLSEIKRRADIEKQHRNQRFSGFNPERQALRNDRSAVHDSILRKARTLLANENEPLSRLIWEYETLRDQAAALVKHNALKYWIETRSDETRLCAIPNDLNEQLSDDLWSKNVPSVLMSDMPSALAVKL